MNLPGRGKPIVTAALDGAAMREVQVLAIDGFIRATLAGSSALETSEATGARLGCGGVLGSITTPVRT